jgi:cytoskeletal protein CcmA (bactofilin family)
MSTSPRRRLFDTLSGSPTLLGEGARFIGDLECEGPLVLCGQVRGDGRIDGALNIAGSAHWEGNVTAQQAVVTGRVSGSLTVAGKLEIGRSAVIHGSVTAQSLAIAQGAVVDGDIRVTGEAPITRFEERRS